MPGNVWEIQDIRGDVIIARSPATASDPSKAREEAKKRLTGLHAKGINADTVVIADGQGNEIARVTVLDLGLPATGTTI